MFTLEILDTLASGLGDFARGAKKLRSVVLSLKKNMEQTYEQSVDISDSEAPSEPETPSEPEVEEPSIFTEDFIEKAENYFKSKRIFVGLRKPSVRRFYNFLLNKRIRQDRFKNTWVYNAGCLDDRSSWAKISEQQAKSVYSRVRGAWETLQSLFENENRPDNITEKKWRRRSDLLSVRLPDNMYKATIFRSVTQDLHSDLPKLR